MPHRTSTYLRMHRRLVAGCVGVVAAVGLVFGGTQVVPYISSSQQTTSSNTASIDVGASADDLFATNSVHEVSLDISQEALDEMLTDYQEDDDKTWVEASITIDGVTVDSVGVRLKGNSTLRTLSGSSGGGPGGAPGATAPDGEGTSGEGNGDDTATSTTDDGEATTTDGTTQGQDGMGGPGAMAGGGMAGTQDDGTAMGGQMPGGMGGGMAAGGMAGGAPGAEGDMTMDGTVPDGTIPDGAAQDGAAQDGAPTDLASSTDEHSTEGATTTDGTTDDGSTMGSQMPGGMGGDMGGGGGMGGSTSEIDEDDPSTWPLLIRFDKYVEGQNWQGHTQISVRPGTANINEALSITLTEDTDQVTQAYTYATYTVNDSATTTRLLLINPDEDYANSLGNGVLFKADAESDFSYQGEDQTEYEDDFTQINDEGGGDVQPIINLLKWLDEADDETFAEELGDYIDVEEFARYLATQNLLGNSDDMSGPGKNYYLWYDYDTGLISIISWDLNMTMNGTGTADPDTDATMGGGGGGGAPGETTTTEGDAAAGTAGGPPGMATRDGSDDAQDTATGDIPAGQPSLDTEGGDDAASEGSGHGGGGDAPGGGMQSGNELKERFLDNDIFYQLYLAAWQDLYEQIYGSGLAEEELDAIAATVPVTEGLTEEEKNTAVQRIQQWVQQRSAGVSTSTEQTDSDGATIAS